MSTPNTKNWKAWENRFPGTGKISLHVSGEVETTNSNQEPQLSEAVPQGTNPTILILDLSISASGIGNTVMGWRNVKFEKEIAPGQYNEIEIRFGSATIATCSIDIAR